MSVEKKRKGYADGSLHLTDRNWTLKDAYQVTYTDADGEIQEVKFWSHITPQDADRRTLNLKKRGLEKSITQLDDAFVRDLMNLVGIKSCEPSELFFSAWLAKPTPEKVIYLKPRRRGQPPSGAVPTTNERQNREAHDEMPA